MSYVANQPVYTSTSHPVAGWSAVKHRIRMVLSEDTTGTKTPEQMLGVIASNLGMSADFFSARTRKREVVELRFLAAMLLRRYFPTITLKQIGALYGGQDHSSVINAIVRANDLLYINDPVFTYKHDHAISAINKWIRQ